MDFSQITDDLFIGTTPTTKDYKMLYDLGVRLVINMRWEHRPKPNPFDLDLKLLWLRTFDSPLFPIPVRKLEKGAQAAMDTIQAGGKVYAHCAGGRHRGVAMGAAILIAQGHAPREAMDLIKTKRWIADPDVSYIRKRIQKFAKKWE
jgi:protein tyrosine phosphatase (PTP) superfamily phosphohydrolase (DUF442 family)